MGKVKRLRLGFELGIFGLDDDFSKFMVLEANCWVEYVICGFRFGGKVSKCSR